MTRRALASVAVVVAACVGAATRPLAQREPSPAGLYAAYVAGEYDAIPRALRTRQDYARIRGALQQQLSAWQLSDKLLRPKGDGHSLNTGQAVEQKWPASHAAFLFEVAAIVMESDAPAGYGLLEAARDLVTHRPDAPGDEPSADRFEIAFHRAVIAVLYHSPTTADAYLTQIAGRLKALGAYRESVSTVARLFLARGILREIRSKPLVTDAGATGAEHDSKRAVLQTALLTFEDIRDLPVELAAERDVRRGFLWHRLGRQDRALEAVDQGLARATDRSVLYWGALIRGRALEAAGRSPEAVTAFERAAALWPTAQTPAIALAALLVQQDNREAALRWAAAARSMPERSLDPWWQYWYGDLRFIPELVRELRQARP